jgi:hypothetical protein
MVHQIELNFFVCFILTILLIDFGKERTGQYVFFFSFACRPYYDQIYIVTERYHLHRQLS